MYVRGELATSPKFAVDPATYLCQPYLQSAFYLYFSSITTLKDFLYCSLVSPPLFLSLSLCLSCLCTRFCFRMCQLVWVVRMEFLKTLEGYWSHRNTGLSMRLRCECGLLVRMRPQREGTKGHSGSLWHPNMKELPFSMRINQKCH